jgi:uncharacterized protein (TIGR03437 family)
MAYREECLQAPFVPSQLQASGRPRLGPAFKTALLLMCCALDTAAQSPQSIAALPTAKLMEMQQTRYELRAGEPAQISAASDALNFLLKAKSRRIEIQGAKAEGLVVGPNRAGDGILLAASLRAKPGEYTVTLSAKSEAGEERQAALTMVVQPRQAVPSGSARPPVVLLNGWEVGFTNSCPISGSSTDTFGNLASYLVSDGVPIVYLFDNCVEDPNQPIEALGNDLGTFLNSIQYDTGAQVPQIDLVGFSLGGLIARAYLAGLQPNESLTPPTNTLVRDMVLIASPNFGSFVAGNYAAEIQTGTQSGELVPGSAFLWNLATWNQRTDDLRGVNAIAVIGNAGEYLPNLSSGTENNNASDGTVSLASASLGFVYPHSASATRIVPYCHVDPSAFTNTTLGTFLCNAPGIANVTSESQFTGQIVRSFLAGTSAWSSIGSTPATDPYLSQYGGMFFAVANTAGSFVSDLSEVEWGTLLLQVGGDIDTIFYDDLIAGTGAFTVTSASLGTVGCPAPAVATVAPGYSSAVRCKIGPNINTIGIGPEVSLLPLIVNAGSTITIAGEDFSGLCNGCKVIATPAGSTTGQILQVTSWTNTAIKAVLPATLTGLITITVDALPGTDAMAIIAAAPNPSTIAAAPASLQFAYTIGGAAPSAQSIQITNSGSGTLAWTATASASWLSVSAASGTAPSTLSVSISTAGLSAGTYNGNIQLSSTGASNTPLSVAVSLTVTQAPPALAVAPQALTFNYTAGGAAPAAQSVSITNAGAGALSWTASTSDYWIAVSAASGSAPGTLSISINPANLAAGTYTSAVQITAAGASGSPASIAITLVVQGTQPAANITSVTNAGSFQPGVASATWVSIFGTNLSTVTYTWQASDFVNGLLPTSLEGVSVTINGLPAYIDYLSPTQINVLAPDDATAGPVQVQVTAAQEASNSVTVQKSQFAPAFFTIDNGAYVAALHADYTLVGSANLLPGVTTQPAQPGETILLYGTGFGPTNPALPTAQLVTTPAVLANSVQVTIGGATAAVVYAGLVEPGLYQLNVTVPSLPNGDAAVVATIGGVSSQTGVSITVHQ